MTTEAKQDALLTERELAEISRRDRAVLATGVTREEADRRALLRHVDALTASSASQLARIGELEEAFGNLLFEACMHGLKESHPDVVAGHALLREKK